MVDDINNRILAFLQPENVSRNTEGIKSMVQRLSTDTDVIADGSKPYTLPTISGKHSDLKSITPQTVRL